MLEISSDPGALLRGRRLMMLFTYPGDTVWIGGFANVFRIRIELATSKLLADVELRGQVRLSLGN